MTERTAGWLVEADPRVGAVQGWHLPNSVGAMQGSARIVRFRWVCPGEPNVIDESNFGLVLRGVRLRAGLSQRELAARMGSTQSAIARMEKGEAEPKLCTLEKLAEAVSGELFVYVRPVEQHE